MLAILEKLIEKKGMTVLAIDTALKACSVALWRKGVLLAAQSTTLTKGHAEVLPPMVFQVLGEAKLSAPDITRVGVVIGPGGFAGVRVGLAFARNFVLGMRADVVGITSLEALAGGVDRQVVNSEPQHEAGKNDLCAVLIDARRGQVYAGLYEPGGACLVPPFVDAPDQAIEKLKAVAGARKVIAIGDGCLCVPQMPASWAYVNGNDTINAGVVASLASKASSPQTRPAPLYLRAPDAKPPRKGSIFDGLLPLENNQ